MQRDRDDEARARQGIVIFVWVCMLEDLDESMNHRGYVQHRKLQMSQPCRAE